jgi:ceramide glucosyltransferase
VAGLATASAQKSHNLARALARYDDGSRIIVLADADIVPQPHWLADIVQPLVRGRARMVSGYRWTLPMDCRPGTLIGAWTERAIASLPKPPWYLLAWGGSIGFTPGTPAAIGAVPVLERAVSDDISLAHAARRNGIDVLYRKRLLVPTPVSHSLACADELRGAPVPDAAPASARHLVDGAAGGRNSPWCSRAGCGGMPSRPRSGSRC